MWNSVFMIVDFHNYEKKKYAKILIPVQKITVSNITKNTPK